MNQRKINRIVNEICINEFSEKPIEIVKMKTGICNEVFEIKFTDISYILRMNQVKEFLYGTHRFLPIFKKLDIKTPKIIRENYSKDLFLYCYQILSKIEGQDLGIVINKLSVEELKSVAKEISSIFDKFKSLPEKEGFGEITGLNEEKFENYDEIIKNQKKVILERNSKTGVISDDIIQIYNELIDKYENYFRTLKPKLYYDDICSKNVMIYKGKFNGLVDLDFLMKGDYLEAIGRIIASWHGDSHGENYINEVIKLQNLTNEEKLIAKMYAVLNLTLWMSEEGIQFNSNSNRQINWIDVADKKEKIYNLFSTL